MASQTTLEHDSTASEEDAYRVPIRGRLIGITATGPIFKGTASFAAVPVSSAIALLQEVARKIEDDEALVSSSLAGRVAGLEAHSAWIRLSTEVSVQLAVMPPQARVFFLRTVLAAVHRAGAVDGLEPVLGAAINATWQWLNPDTVDRLINYALAHYGRSSIAATRTVPIVDVSSRTASLFGPGDLVRLDLEEWRIKHRLDSDQYLSGIPGLGPKGDIFNRGVEDRFGYLFDGSGSGLSGDELASDLLGEGSPGMPEGGIPGGPLGRRDLPGAAGQGSRGSGRSREQVVSDLLGEGSPGMPEGGIPGGPLGRRDLPGAAGQGSRGPGRSLAEQANDLLAGQRGEYGSIGLGGFTRDQAKQGAMTGAFPGAIPGGPLAPTGKLGVNGWGEQGWKDGVKDIATGAAILGTTAIAIASAPVTVPAAILVGGAVVAGAAAGTFLGIGVVEVVDDKPEPPREKPRNGDLYPDPYGTGGGHPTQIWDEEGGGGTPNTIWDEEGGGGTPNTIWDDAFGGTGPTTAPQIVDIPCIMGPGLQASLVQVGPTTIRF